MYNMCHNPVKPSKQEPIQSTRLFNVKKYPDIDKKRTLPCKDFGECTRKA